MVAMRVMKTPVNEVIQVIPVGHALVAAAFAVQMTAGMPLGHGRAAVRIPRGDLDAALVHVVAVHCVQAAVVQVIDVVAVTDGRVPAAFAVDVRVLRMNPVLRHGQSFFIPESAGKG